MSVTFYEDRKDLQQVNIFIFVYYYAFPAHINANEVIVVAVNVCACLIFHRKTTCIQTDFWVHFYFIKFLLIFACYTLQWNHFPHIQKWFTVE